LGPSGFLVGLGDLKTTSEGIAVAGLLRTPGLCGLSGLP